MRQGEANTGRAASKKLYAIALAMLVMLARMAAAQEAPTRRILVSIPDRKLALIEDGQVVRVYPVAVGAEVSESPSGEFKIINRLTNPTYYHPGKVIGPGVANPLGSRWMGLDRPHYGIHGTNVPSSIGKAASHGCIRMSKRDLEELFNLVRVGDVVEVRAERDNEVAQVFGVATDAPAMVAVAAGGGR